MLPYEIERGFALVTVLIFLQIISLIGLFLMQNAISLKKMTQGLLHQTELLMSAESELSQIDLTRSACDIPVMTASELQAKPLNWWQTMACAKTSNSLEYYYVIEHIGDDPCASIDASQKNFSVHYFRITLFVHHPTDDAKEWLQTTVIKQDNASHECQAPIHSVIGGKQMWRELR